MPNLTTPGGVERVALLPRYVNINVRYNYDITKRPGVVYPMRKSDCWELVYGYSSHIVNKIYSHFLTVHALE